MKKALKSFLLFFITAYLFAGLFFPPRGACEEDLTLAAFLATAKNDPALADQHEKTGFLLQAGSNTPFFDRVELRTETDEFRPSRQTYRVRTYPGGWGKTEADRSEYDAVLASSRLRRDLLLHRALRERYLAALDFMFAREALKQHKKLCAVYRDRLGVLNNFAGIPGFDMDDLLKARDAYSRQQLEVLAGDSSLGVLEAKIRGYAQAEVTVACDTAGLPSVEQVFAAIAGPEGIFDERSIYLKESTMNVRVAQSRYDREAAENSRLVSFFEVSYDNGRRHDTREAFALQLGLRLPFISSDRLELNREKLRFLDEKMQHDGLKRFLQEKHALLRRELQGLLQQYRLAQRTGAPSGMDAKDAAPGPLILLRLQESMINSRIRLSEIARLLYTKYIEVLDVTGRLSERPLKNYLSAAGEEPGL